MKASVRIAPQRLRMLIRAGKWDRPTAGQAPGYVQANLVVLPEKYAFDFLLFCQRNPKPCPLLEVLEPGKSRTRILSATADVRTDLPRYHLYRQGKLAGTVGDIRKLWRDDFVTFLLGCSFSFEEALLAAGVSVRHMEEDCNVPMYITNRPCQPAGMMHGPLVVSMRPMPRGQVAQAVRITSRYPGVHGGPVHIGDPAAIGIKDLGRPDYGDAVTVKRDEVPVFWACGVTPQAVVLKSKPDLCITHAPGYMLVTDLPNEELVAGRDERGARSAAWERSAGVSPATPAKILN